MTNWEFNDKSGEQKELLPEGNFIGVCVGVAELGTHIKFYQGKEVGEVPKVGFDIQFKDKATGKIHHATKKVNFSNSKKGNLYKFVSPFMTGDSINPEKLLKRFGTLVIKHGTSDSGYEYAYVDSFSPLADEVTETMPEFDGDTYIYTITSGEGGAYSSLPQGFKNELKRAIENGGVGKWVPKETKPEVAEEYGDEVVITDEDIDELDSSPIDLADIPF